MTAAVSIHAIVQLQSLLRVIADHTAATASVVAAIDLTRANVLELDFLLQAAAPLRTFLASQQLHLRLDGQRLILVDTTSSQDVAATAVASLIDKIDALPIEPAVDYVALVGRITKAVFPLIVALCTLVPEEELRKIKVMPVVNSGEEWSIEYEVCFAAAYGNLMFPDASTFTPEHATYAASRGYCKLQTITTSYYRWCFVAILHELIHNIQGIRKQNDPTGWALEHDASRCQILAVAALSEWLRRTDAEAHTQLFGPHDGAAAEVALWALHTTHDLHNKVPQDARDVYNQWRDSFGVAGPVEDDSFTFNLKDEESYVATMYYKSRVGVEAYYHARSLVQQDETRALSLVSLHKALLNTCFHDGRIGNLRATTVPQSREIAIASDLTFDAILDATDAGLAEQAALRWQ